jgi:hypothetical protein
MKQPAPAQRLTLLLLVVRLLTLVLPTAVAGAFVLYQANISYTALDTGIGAQAAWFAGALTVSYIIFAYRGRFIIFTPLLLLGLWITGRIIRQLPGEFDVFVAVARFDLHSALIVVYRLNPYTFAMVSGYSGSIVSHRYTRQHFLRSAKLKSRSLTYQFPAYSRLGVLYAVYGSGLAGFA